LFISKRPEKLLDCALSWAPLEVADSDETWDSLLLAARTHMNHTESSGDRILYRAAALAALNGAYAFASMSRPEWATECIDVRVYYLLRVETKGERDPLWIAEEARRIAELFSKTVELEFEVVAKAIPVDPGRTPDYIAEEVHRIARMLDRLKHICHLVPPDRRTEIERWLSLRGKLY
jgi:hypothetical protein